MTDKVKNELIDLLSELENYMEDKADADYINEQFVPNTEMQLQVRIGEVRAKVNLLDKQETKCFSVAGLQVR